MLMLDFGAMRRTLLLFTFIVLWAGLSPAELVRCRLDAAGEPCPEPAVETLALRDLLSNAGLLRWWLPAGGLHCRQSPCRLRPSALPGRARRVEFLVTHSSAPSASLLLASFSKWLDDASF